MFITIAIVFVEIIASSELINNYFAHAYAKCIGVVFCQIFYLCKLTIRSIRLLLVSFLVFKTVVWISVALYLHDVRGQ